MKQQINEIKRMQQLAGIITENQANEKVNILPFLKSYKQELLDKLAKMLEWDEDDIEAMEKDELVGGITGTDENEDTKVAGFKYIGLQFAFDPEDLENEEDAAEFKLNIAGKPVYGLYYSM
jgi:hypothetical protein